MTFKFQKGIFTCGKTVINRLHDFLGVLYNFERWRSFNFER
jgi:hypothetical protein